MKTGTLRGVVSLCLGFLGGILGSLLLLNVFKKESPLYGVVDTHKLIQKQVAVLLRDHKEASEETLSRDVIGKLHRILTTWYRQNHIIVFDKKHVLTPLSDVTKRLLKTMESNSISPELRLPGLKLQGSRPLGSRPQGARPQDLRS